MPYVSNYRAREYRKTQFSVTTRGNPNTVVSGKLEVPLLIESVYSWRTGNNVVSDPFVPTKGVDGWGITTPRHSGSLTSQLGDRKRYYEEVMRSAFPAETATGSTSNVRASATDSGHLFSTVKTVRYPCSYFIRAWDSNWTSAPHLQGKMLEGILHVPTDGTPAVPAFGNATYAFGTRPISLLSESERSGLQNRLFAATAPNMSTGTLLVTIAELLRGDIPGIIGNFRKMRQRMVKLEARWKQQAWFTRHDKISTLSRYAGGEYLNVVFGWKPIIDELANILLVLITLDRMVYSETNRRKRHWDGPHSEVSLVTNSVSLQQYPYQGGVAGASLYKEATYPSIPFSVPLGTRTTQRNTSEDYMFSSRYSAIAKPNSASNGFVEKAEETLRRLGLISESTLADLWELTAWSWLIDWVFTIGHSINNAATYSPITGKHSVDYAYLTTQIIQSEETTWKVTSQPSSTKSLVPIKGGGKLYSRSRTRDRATPFGFGTQLASLSSGQFAILVALGLAKWR